jgi:hypothetical protein
VTTQDDALDAELNRILAMPEDQLDAEIRAAGGDPDDYAERGRLAVTRALIRVNATRCGPDGLTAGLSSLRSLLAHSPETRDWATAVRDSAVGLLDKTIVALSERKPKEPTK